MKADAGEKTVTLTLTANDKAAKKFKASFGDRPEILSVECKHPHYVQNDEYIPYGEDRPTFWNAKSPNQSSIGKIASNSATKSGRTNASTAITRPPRNLTIQSLPRLLMTLDPIP